MMRWTVCALLLALISCARGRILIRPTSIDQVGDGMAVAYRVAPESVRVVGRALGWESRRPRLVTARGDTLTVPSGARVQVRVDHPKRHTKTGAVIGYVAGLSIMLADCGGKKYCGEQDLRPVLGILLGAFAGWLAADDWIDLPP